MSTEEYDKLYIDFEPLRKGLEDKSLTYLDVRQKSELETDGKVVGSVNLPLPEITEGFHKGDQEFLAAYGFPKPEKSASHSLVVACLGGKRAAAAADQLRQLGYDGVRVYVGSFKDWVEKGGPIAKP